MSKIKFLAKLPECKIWQQNAFEYFRYDKILFFHAQNAGVLLFFVLRTPNCSYEFIPKSRFSVSFVTGTKFSKWPICFPVQCQCERGWARERSSSFQPRKVKRKSSEKGKEDQKKQRKDRQSCFPRSLPNVHAYTTQHKDKCCLVAKTMAKSGECQSQAFLHLKVPRLNSTPQVTSALWATHGELSEIGFQPTLDSQVKIPFVESNCAHSHCSFPWSFEN